MAKSGWMSWDADHEMSGWPTALTEDGEWRTVTIHRRLDLNVTVSFPSRHQIYISIYFHKVNCNVP